VLEHPSASPGEPIYASIFWSSRLILLGPDVCPRQVARWHPRGAEREGFLTEPMDFREPPDRVVQSSALIPA